MSLPYSSTMAAEDAEKADSAARSARGAGRGGASPAAAAPDHDAQGLRERDRGRDGGRRLDQRRAAPARDRARGRGAARRSTTSRPSAQRVPVLCDLKPSGRYVATDLHRVGGIPQVMKMLLAHGLLHGDALTITGRRSPRRSPKFPTTPRKDQDVIRPWDRPMYAQGHLAILRGNLAHRGRGREDHRHQASRDHRAGARVRSRGGHASTRSSRARSRPATCW